MFVNKMQVEYQENPLGIDVPQPRLSWELQASTRGQQQTAYQIIVSEREESIQQERGELWDSGKVHSTQSLHIPYAGSPLRSSTRYYWRVRVWDSEERVTAFSPLAWWEMGLCEAEDWSAQWIQAPQTTVEDGTCPQFRRVFHLDQPIRQARLALCGLGHYELSLNGTQVSERVLEPGWTNYRKTCLYNRYDVTHLLQRGENVVGVLLGNGMYRVLANERYNKFTGSFGAPKLLLQLDIVLADDTTMRIVSDKQWQTCGSALTFSSIYGGEDYDARRELPGWNAPGFQADARWMQAEIAQEPGRALRAQQHPSSRVVQTFRPLTWTRLAPGRYLADFGQNFAGWMRVVLRGTAGACVKMTPAEIVKDGTTDQSQSGTPVYFQYTLKGGETEEWHPRFSYYGFRYLLLEDAVPGDDLSNADEQTFPVIESLSGEMISADVQVVGEFHCSNELINHIHHLIVMAMRSNLQSILTDCPQREKLGWLEQVYLMGPSLMSNYAVPNLYRSMSENMRDAQREDGLVPDIAPEYVVFADGFLDSPEWGSACILAPWLMYQYYQDRALLAEHYPVMQRYLTYLGTRATDSILDHGLGDWCDIGPQTPFPSQTPRALTATAFYYYDAVLLARISSLLHKSAEAEAYTQLAEEVNQSFQRRFFDPEHLTYASGSQAANAIPLVFGIVEPSLCQAVLDALVRDIQARDYHTTAGDIGYRFVLQALERFDRPDIIFALSQQTSHPSYGFQLAHGATALTELWDGPISGASQNHLMLGHIEEWFYSGLAGIRLDYTTEPSLTIKPAFVGDIRWVKATRDIPTGRVTVAWEIQDTGQFRLALTIPANQTALLYLPARKPEEILEGDCPVTESNDIHVLRMEGRYTVLQIASGDYLFTGPMSAE